MPACGIVSLGKRCPKSRPHLALEAFVFASKNMKRYGIKVCCK